LIDARSQPAACHPYHRPLDLPFVLPTRMYTGMLVVWLLRPALRKRFPLHKGRPSDYLNFLAWCTSIGRRQYRLLREIDAWNRELMQPMALPALPGCPWQECYSVAMYLAGITRAKYWQGQLLGKRAMRHRAARWFFRDGRELLGLPHCPAWQRMALKAQYADAESFVQVLLLPKDREQEGGELRIRMGVADLVAGWDEPVPLAAPSTAVAPERVAGISRALGRWLPVEANEMCWAAQQLRQVLPLPAPDFSDIRHVMNTVPVEPSTLSSEAVQHPWGVNLIGYARGELGIGEDVRMLARSLEAAQVPFCIINVEPGANVSQADTSAEHWIAEEPCYAISLFCMTGIEMARLTAEKGLGWLEGRYNIGLWPWELPTWPEPWEHAWSLVDELWGISRYAANAYRRSPVPVHPMPLPVQLCSLADKGRLDWGLPEDTYLFVFAFDMNSTLARKNPMATVKAFLAAFADQPDAKVGLVIKVSHLDVSVAAWKPLQALIKRDPRIHLISGELRKDEVLALYKACDCFVSLHRAEGFGRGLAEAQLLGLELIATGYSGNMDFCTDNATRTVDYRLIEVKDGEYFFGDGQQWAEPLVDEAAKHMKECVAAHVTDRAPRYPLERFTPEYCGAIYRERLEQLVGHSVPTAHDNVPAVTES